MKKRYGICYFISFTAAMLVMNSPASAHEKVVVVPLGGAVGNATVADVVKDKTFSSKSGKGLTGILEQHPMGQSYTNSIGMTFNLLPAGTFTMGSPDGSGSEPAEPGRITTETQHQVTLSQSYYMQTTEVTNKQWNTIIFDSGLGAKPSLSHIGDNYPVDNVNWFEAAYFSNRLSVVEGLTSCYSLYDCDATVPGAGMACLSVDISETCSGYRLPTEAEWEYAARATTTASYSNPVYFDETETETGGNFNANLHPMGWYFFNRNLENTYFPITLYEDGTKPVAVKQANYWGLYDMHGNVNEWCRDWWDGSAYSPNPVVDPTGDVTGTTRGYRGGNWSWWADMARSAYRDRRVPVFRSDELGFRLILPSGE